MNLLKQIEQEQITKLTAGKEIPDFAPGDTVVVEGDEQRRTLEFTKQVPKQVPENELPCS